MSLDQNIGSVKYMEKRIPKNAKYEHVKSRLDTGYSLTKYLERLEAMKKTCRKRDEMFKRLKVTTFAHIVLQLASVNEPGSDGDALCRGDGLSVAPEMELRRQAAGNAGETWMGVAKQVGELHLDRRRSHATARPRPEPEERPYPDCPYLLLDVRERDLYDRCHLISAHSFPIARLSRSNNPYTREVLEYRNAPEKIIIVYGEDEILASQAATRMCERGFENLFLLTGGLKNVCKKFPEGLTTGSFHTSTSITSSSSGGPAAEGRWRFRPDELEKVQMQLEEMFVPSGMSSTVSGSASSRTSSRASSISSHSRTSSVGSRWSPSSSTGGRDVTRVRGDRPWK